MKRLIIIGTSGSALDILDILECLNVGVAQWEIAGFLDDSRPKDSAHYGIPILGPLDSAPRFTDCRFINAIGSDRNHAARDAILAKAGIPGERYATLIHPKASVSPRAKLRNGVYVCAGAVVAGGVTLEEQSTIHPGVIIGHDTTVGAYGIIAPGAVLSGFVKTGLCAYVGANAVVRQGLTIGDRVLVGMGAVVTKDVSDGCVVGNPARPYGVPKP